MPDRVVHVVNAKLYRIETIFSRHQRHWKPYKNQNFFVFVIENIFGHEGYRRWLQDLAGNFTGFANDRTLISLKQKKLT
jgi:hypothetical protein